MHFLATAEKTSHHCQLKYLYLDQTTLCSFISHLGKIMLQKSGLLSGHFIQELVEKLSFSL